MKIRVNDDDIKVYIKKYIISYNKLKRWAQNDDVLEVIIIETILENIDEMWAILWYSFNASLIVYLNFSWLDYTLILSSRSIIILLFMKH